VLAYYVWPAVEERFYGITREFDTPSPLDAALAEWNKLAAFFVLAAAVAYAALTGYASALPMSLPSDAVTVSGFTVTPTYILYTIAAGAGLLGALPAAVYYAWPSIQERRRADSKRNAFILWGGTLVGGLTIGSILGYLYVAPVIISYFVYDAINAGMIITYTINDFFWLVFLTTVGIGLLAEVPLTMWLFHYTGIVSYEQMRRRWRGVVFIVFVAAAILTNRSVITMLIFGVPVTFMYWVGLTGLWVRTLPRRMISGRRATAEK
jgi:sec-independent protein translocase protein TatC